MPRTARRRSLSGTYHVVARGSSREIIFEDDDDRAFFMTRASDLAPGAGCAIYAWCLMDNHVHLLLQVGHESLSGFMHALLTGYAGYFNRVHGRTGRLFEGRFESEPVDDDGYLLAAMRHIHRNPVKAGLPEGLLFPWSSYGQYANGSAGWAVTEPVMGMLGGRDGFVRFHEEGDEGGRCLEIPEPARRAPSDAEALRIADAVLGKGVAREVKSMPRVERDAAIAALKERGLSVRQVQRLTGVSLGVISHAGK